MDRSVAYARLLRFVEIGRHLGGWISFPKGQVETIQGPLEILCNPQAPLCPLSILLLHNSISEFAVNGVDKTG